MKKARKLWLTFGAAMLLGIVFSLVGISDDVCEYFCPRNYPPPSGGSQCTKCCDEKCPTMGGNIGRCYLNCSAKV
ncbi:hypothetical protein GG496_001641 [Candidatus Fervidibacteria bacterium JGI MDM2 JNZ-1-D12]